MWQEVRKRDELGRVLFSVFPYKYRTPPGALSLNTKWQRGSRVSVCVYGPASNHAVWPNACWDRLYRPETDKAGINNTKKRTWGSLNVWAMYDLYTQFFLLLWCDFLLAANTSPQWSLRCEHQGWVSNEMCQQHWVSKDSSAESWHWTFHQARTLLYFLSDQRFLDLNLHFTSF